MNEQLLPRLANVSGFLLDMDGTLYVGPNAMTGASDFISALKTASLPYLVFTNNSSRAKGVYRDRLGKLSMETRLEHVLTSGDASAGYLAHETTYRRVFVLGTEALKVACKEAGLTVCAAHEAPDCVLLGYDITLTYASLTDACLLVAEGLPYYATHADKTCIDPRGLLPDAGAIIAAIETTTGLRPAILGKPELSMLDAGLRKLKKSKDQVMIVGDQLDTDITMGAQHNVLSCLVLSGETSRAQLETSDVSPDLVVENIGELHALFKKTGRLTD